jgi:hypothetical protein
MIDRYSDRAAKTAPTLVLAALAFTLAGCASGTNCALFGLQCGTPTAEQESKAAAAEATLKQEGAVLGPTGHYGTPYGPGPQYGGGGGDQYGYGPGYGYARQAPEQPNDTEQQQK